MKVFIVLEHDYEGDYVKGVYSSEDAAKAHEAEDVNHWIAEEDVRDAFIAPAPVAPPQCEAVSARLKIPCRLLRGHDGPHECLLPERTS